MAWKLESRNRNVYLSNTETNVLHSGGGSEFGFYKEKTTSLGYVVHLRGQNISGGEILFSEFVDSNGNSFDPVLLQDFIDAKTGFNSASGGSGAGVLAVNNRTGYVQLTKVDLGLDKVNNTEDLKKPLSEDAIAALALKLNNTLLAVSNGVATLGSDSKLLAAQIPDSLLSGLKWQSTWNVSTNTPAIAAAATGNKGFFYKVNVGGTSSITGSSTTWGVGDWLISNGTSWQRVPNADAVASVNGQFGVVSLNATHVGAMSLTNFGVGSKGTMVTGAGPAGVTTTTPLGTNGQILSADPTALGGVKWVDPTPVAVGFNTGDTKFGYRTADHSGWYVLDGRSVSLLSPTAQAAAATLGWGANIPDTRGKFPLAASQTIDSGTNGGSNTIARANLPNVTLSGNTGNESASHTHTTAGYTIAETTASEYATDSANPNVIAFPAARVVVSDNGAALAGTDYSFLALDGIDRAVSDASTLHSHSITIDVPLKTSGANNSNHTHAFTTPSINGNVAQTTFMPTYSAKTEFVYLGL